MKNVLYLFFCLIVLFSCKPEKKEHPGFSRQFDLKHKEYATEPYTYYPHNLFVKDSLLFLPSARIPGNEGCFGQIYSIDRDMQLVGQFGTIGRGPREFINPEIISAMDNKLVIQNINLREIAMMEVSVAGDSVIVEEKERLKFESLMTDEMMFEPYNISMLDKDHFVGGAYLGQGEFFALYDSRMNLIGHFGDPPLNEKLSWSGQRTGLNGKLRTHNGTMVYSVHKLPIVVCYKMENGRMVKKWEDTYFKSECSVSPGGDLAISRSKTVGFSPCMALGGKYIYVLFNDMPWKDFQPGTTDMFEGKVVFVYDYDGNRIARLNLDRKVAQICLSKDETKIYAYTAAPEEHILEFDVPEEL